MQGRLSNGTAAAHTHTRTSAPLRRYADLVEAGSMAGAKDAGKVRSEGKEYEVKEGDVMLFRFNV